MRSASVYGRRRQLAPGSPTLFDVDEPRGVFDRRTAAAVSLPVSSVTITLVDPAAEGTSEMRMTSGWQNEFAYYGRVSAENQQDPEVRRGWQLRRARSLIASVNDLIVEDFSTSGCPDSHEKLPVGGHETAR